MKIRIVQAGYETFTGLLGDVKFEGGVSVREVSEQQAAYVGAMFVIAREDEVIAPVEPNKPVIEPESVPPMPEGAPVEPVAEPVVEAPAEGEQGSAE